MKSKALQNILRIRESLCRRPIQLAARIGLSVAIIAMFLGMHESADSHHSDAWEVVAAIGFALAIVSLPTLAYGSFLRSRHLAAARDRDR